MAWRKGLTALSPRLARIHLKPVLVPISPPPPKGCPQLGPAPQVQSLAEPGAKRCERCHPNLALITHVHGGAVRDRIKEPRSGHGNRNRTRAGARSPCAFRGIHLPPLKSPGPAGRFVPLVRGCPALPGAWRKPALGMSWSIPHANFPILFEVVALPFVHFLPLGGLLLNVGRAPCTNAAPVTAGLTYNAINERRADTPNHRARNRW